MTTTTLSTPEPSAGEKGRPPATQRLGALARAVDRARRQRRPDIRKVMAVGGAVAMGLGMVAIVLGWYGAAHSPYLFQEIPYLISGGLLGVALVAAGGFSFFGAWIIRMIEEDRRHAARMERTLDRVDRVLTAVVSDAAAAAIAGTPTNGYRQNPGHDLPDFPEGHGGPVSHHRSISEPGGYHPYPGFPGFPGSPGSPGSAGHEPGGFEPGGAAR